MRKYYVKFVAGQQRLRFTLSAAASSDVVERRKFDDDASEISFRSLSRDRAETHPATMPRTSQLITTLSSTASPRAGFSLTFNSQGNKERARKVLLPDALTGLDLWDLFLASFPRPSGHARVYYASPR